MINAEIKNEYESQYLEGIFVIRIKKQIVVIIETKKRNKRLFVFL